MSEVSLQQSLGQHQMLAPQMRRSLELLQAGALELSQIVQQALETNPVLEDVGLSEPLDGAAEPDDLPRPGATEDDRREEAILRGRARSWEGDEQARERLYQSIVAPLTLQRHLIGQVETAAAAPAVRDAARALVGALDDRGFFEQAPEEVGRQFGIDRPVLAAALALVRSLDPPGIGARDLRDSLLIQLEQAGLAGTLRHRIVDLHLEDLARKRYPVIARALATSVESVAEAAALIARLNPNPGGDFNPTANPHVRPDVVIERGDDGGFHAQLTNEYLPRLKISDYYKDLLARTGSDAEARRYLRDHLREGRALLRSLSLRQETILAIAERIVAHQQPFLRHGPRHLRPLTMNDVAAELGLHATTVSRAVAGKYVLTPHGLMEMRAFFATGYQSADGTEVSNAGVREQIQRLIAAEDPARPLSDDAIHKALAAGGLKVARRTVAKYREQLGILPSHLRKAFTA